MLRVTSELRLWKRDQAEEVIREALAVVVTIEPPDDLREAVFTQACGMLAQRQVELEKVEVQMGGMAIPRNGR